MSVAYGTVLASDLCYLDHAATTPMRDDARGGDAAVLHRAVRQPERVAPLRPRRQAGGRRGARRRRRGGRLPARRGGVHRAAAPRATTPRSPGRSRPNVSVSSARPSSTTPCCTSSSGHGGTVVATDRFGRVDLDALEDALDDDVAAVSVMAVNNEVGHDLRPRRRWRRSSAAGAPDAIVHTDAIQAACWLDLRERLAARRRDVAQRPQVRRSEGRRRADRPRRHAR